MSFEKINLKNTVLKILYSSWRDAIDFDLFANGGEYDPIVCLVYYGNIYILFIERAN